MTFDAGSDLGRTPFILDTLARNHVVAMLGFYRAVGAGEPEVRPANGERGA